MPFQPNPDAYIDISSETGEVTRWMKNMADWYVQVDGKNQDQALVLIMVKSFIKPRLRVILKQHMNKRNLKTFKEATDCAQKLIMYQHFLSARISK
jgi:hypothetical protein